MKLLIAEDENDIALLYKIALEKRNHQVITTENGEDCLNAYHEEFQRRRFNTVECTSGQFSPFDAVILDYQIPKIDGMEVAKEILAVNCHQRIIFASAYVKETLVDSITNLKLVVELMQKPFGVNTLIDIVEDKNVYCELQRLNVDTGVIKALHPTHEQVIDLLQRLKDIQKHRTF